MMNLFLFFFIFFEDFWNSISTAQNAFFPAGCALDHIDQGVGGRFPKLGIAQYQWLVGYSPQDFIQKCFECILADICKAPQVRWHCIKQSCSIDRKRMVTKGWVARSLDMWNENRAAPSRVYCWLGGYHRQTSSSKDVWHFGLQYGPQVDDLVAFPPAL